MEGAMRADEYDETERVEIESIIEGLFIARGIVMKHMANEGTNGG